MYFLKALFSQVFNFEEALLHSYARFLLKFTKFFLFFSCSNDFIFDAQLDLLAQLRIRSDNKNVFSKLAWVTFDYTPVEFCLQYLSPPAGRRFRLPLHVNEILMWLKNDPKLCFNVSVS